MGDVDPIHQQARIVEGLNDGSALGDLDFGSVYGNRRHQS
jgi:hypothetical protein